MIYTSLLYNTIILPHFHYSILAWGSQSHLLSKIQKKCIRITTNSRYNAHTEPLFKKHKLLKLDDIYKHQILNFHFKLKNRMLPSYFYTFPTTLNNQVHQLNTRRRNIFPSRVNHEFAKCSLRYKQIDLVNSTPNMILDKINTHSYQGFSKYSKTFYLNRYETTCNNQNCFTCNRQALSII